MDEQTKAKLTLAELQAEAAKYGVKVIDISARFKAIGIVGGVAPRQRETAHPHNKEGQQG